MPFANSKQHFSLSSLKDIRIGYQTHFMAKSGVPYKSIDSRIPLWSVLRVLRIAKTPICFCHSMCRIQMLLCLSSRVLDMISKTQLFVQYEIKITILFYIADWLSPEPYHH